MSHNFKNLPQSSGHDSGHGSHHEGGEHHGHHIFPYASCLKIFGLLMLLTAITVAVAFVDLGKMNLVVALLVATIKGSLVALYFMGLKFDKKDNAVIFATSFLFLIIFIILTGFDLFYRGDVYVKPGVQDAFAKAAQAGAGSKYSKPWMVRDEMVAHGKELFQVQCVACHGAAGQGNGPAAAGLNPKPRNFTAAEGWKNGRKPSQIFTTLTKGLGGMPSFGSLPSDDRWSLAHYIVSLGPTKTEDSNEDLTKAGIDPSGSSAGSAEKSIPVDAAIDLMVKETQAR